MLTTFLTRVAILIAVTWLRLWLADRLAYIRCAILSLTDPAHVPLVIFEGGQINNFDWYAYLIRERLAQVTILDEFSQVLSPFLTDDAVAFKILS
jgi:hypothetical protein